MSSDNAFVDSIVRATAEVLLDRLAPPRAAAPGPCPACRGESDCVVSDTPRSSLAPETAAVARRIDHTLLAPDATEEKILRLCMEAWRFGFATVCVNSVWVRQAACALAGTDVGVCAVVGFPLGAMVTRAKRFEAEAAIADGAGEIDMVIDVGALKGRDDRRVRADVAGVAASVHALGARLKVIVETGLLDDEEKVRACTIAVDAGADFVKTSTGFAKGGATVADVALMRRTVGPDVGVKASGGIGSVADARAFLAAGATRLGTSRSVSIVGGASERSPASAY